MFNLFYYKPKNRNFLENLEKHGIENPQNYVPIYKTFFDLNETNYNNISFNHRHHIVDIVYSQRSSKSEEFCENGLIYDTFFKEHTSQAPFFIKYSPVLDPIHYMMGKYNTKDPRIRNLPQLNSTEETCLPKLLDTNNSSYIDGFFTFLTSILLHNHGVFHGVDYYGSFMGIQREFKINVVEDLEHLDDSDFFHKNLNKLFSVNNPYETPFFCNNSRNCKTRLLISGTDVEFDDADIEVLGADVAVAEIDACFSEPAENPLSSHRSESGENSTSLSEIKDISDDFCGGGDVGAITELELEYEKSSNKSIELNEENDDSSSLNYTTDGEQFDDEISSSDDEETVYTSIDDEDDNESFENSEVLATIYNFPVNMICMEKCAGTLDSIMNNLSEDEWRSALFQVIMILLIYQKTFYLTHNDLHTNNIMFVETTHKHIYYKFDGNTYKIPTFGRIYKIIDYGRAIYTFSGRLFCSDSFDFRGDAATQYNFPPYYNDKRPIVEPNYSFDLCRLGCSIYDFVFENENDAPRTGFEQLVLDWCTDDNGKNVMYKKNGEERYMDFKLYKMIARSVHNHTPNSQLNRAFFSEYRILGEIDKSALSTGLYINIDELPCYA